MTPRKPRSTHKSRLPKYWAAQTFSRPMFNLTADDWKRLEKILGAELRTEDRQVIEAITENYIAWATVELVGPTVRDVLGRLQQLALAARALGVLLVETDSRRLSQAQRSALAAASSAMRTATLGEHTVTSLTDALIAFYESTQACAVEINERTANGLAVMEGVAWSSFIGRLWNFAADRGWKPSASKGQAKSRAGTHSHFVEWIYALQQCLPEQMRRYNTSKETLAREILRAKKVFGNDSGHGGFCAI